MEERTAITLENFGQKIFGIFHCPKNKKNIPAVLICHGLVGNKIGKHRVYVDFSQMLAKEGIASFRFDYRGCGDSENSFHNITPSDHYSDTFDSMDFLKNHPLIDPKRIGIFGRSFGGAVAVKVASQKEVKSIALWCPMFNGKQWEHQWELAQNEVMDISAKQKLMQIDGQQGSVNFFKEFFRIDVTENMKQLQNIPFLHIHGTEDTRVNLEHALLYEKSRSESSAISEFIRLPHTDHDFSSLNERTNALEKTVQWFKETL